eukprot:2812761-Lingulodinium_polyedra.AAC.1
MHCSAGEGSNCTEPEALCIDQHLQASPLRTLGYARDSVYVLSNSEDELGQEFDKISAVLHQSLGITTALKNAVGRAIQRCARSIPSAPSEPQNLQALAAPRAGPLSLARG